MNNKMNCGKEKSLLNTMRKLEERIYFLISEVLNFKSIFQEKLTFFQNQMLKMEI